MESVKIKSSSFICYMRQIVNRYKKQGQCRTGETYDTALNSFLRFRAGEDLPISRMDSGLMEEYEAFLRRAHLTPNTISFYMKHLPAGGPISGSLAYMYRSATSSSRHGRRMRRSVSSIMFFLRICKIYLVNRRDRCEGAHDRQCVG